MCPKALETLCATHTHSLIALPPQSFVTELLGGWPDAVADSRKQLEFQWISCRLHRRFSFYVCVISRGVHEH